jgi:lysozyme family protein
MADFNTAVSLVLQQEGGLHTEPGDTGGLTNWGISQNNNPGLTVATLTQEDAAAWYKDNYWVFDGIKDQRVATLLLSMSVNMGGKVAKREINPAIRVAQKAVGVLQDGLWGPMTEHCLNTTPDVLVELATAYLKKYFLIELSKGNANDLGGWTRRVVQCIAL